MRVSLRPNLTLSSKLRIISGSFLILAGIGLCLTAASPALAGNSATYQVRDDQIGGTYFRQTSNSYTVDGSVEALVGSGNSALYRGQTGSPIRIDSAVPTPDDSAPGGGSPTVPIGCSAPTNFSVSDIQCNRIYKSIIKISGTRDKNTALIFVNNDISGVHLGSSTTWDKDIFLKPGENTIIIYGQNFCDAQTPPITLVLTKADMGDTNDDSRTNDYDLSTFTRRWERRQDCLTDFNRDLITNDYDLSLLASSWSG